MKKLLLISIILLLLPISFAMQGKMPLLAVREEATGLTGSTAELQLEIVEGTGRVFVDTFPLSKIDTQISMRFAKEIACDFIDKDCDKYDFIYTIRAASPIIGGPSAGAAATILTIAILEDLPIDQRTAITGTINSGGLIGPVGGIKQKIEAGSDYGLKTIFIPEGETITPNGTNSTINITTLEAARDIRIIEVSNLYDALEKFTGKTFHDDNQNIEISKSYKDTMSMLARQLCDRNIELREMITDVGDDNSTINTYEDAINLSDKGKAAYKGGEFYASASFCFGSNVKLNEVFLKGKGFSVEKYEGLMAQLVQEIDKFEKDIDSRKIRTITDLESYMIVKERLIEARKFTNITDNPSLAYAYSYGNERLRSAYSWSEFFGNQGKSLQLDDISLRDTCRQRIAEAEERLQYASIYLPFRLNSARDELDLAYDDFNNEDYALCLFKASKSKAAANMVVNTLGIETDYIPTLISNKLDAAARVIKKAESKDMFPVLGYSYYEYATNLKEHDPFSSLLYAEYALELSNLDIYFKETDVIEEIDIDYEKSGLVLLGMAIGILFTLLIRYPKKRRTKKRKKR